MTFIHDVIMIKLSIQLGSIHPWVRFGVIQSPLGRLTEHVGFVSGSITWVAFDHGDHFVLCGDSGSTAAGSQDFAQIANWVVHLVMVVKVCVRVVI